MGVFSGLLRGILGETIAQQGLLYRLVISGSLSDRVLNSMVLKNPIRTTYTYSRYYPDKIPILGSGVSNYPKPYTLESFAKSGEAGR